MKKRLLALILAFACLVNAAPFSVFASEIEEAEPVSNVVTLADSEEQPTEETTDSASEPTELPADSSTEPTEDDTQTAPAGSCGENLTWVLDEDGTLTVSGTGEMNSHGSHTATSWYAFSDSIIHVVIDEGVESIGSHAFAQCRNLTDVTIFADGISIEDYAFANCIALESISFEGDAPEGICANSFNNVVASVNYPAGNPTWAESSQKHFGGSLTWNAYCPNGHDYAEVTTPVTCTTDGYTTHTCTNCGDSYTSNYVTSTGHTFVDGICANCDATFAAPVVSAANTTAGKIKLTWKAVNGASAYEIYVSSDNGVTFANVATVSGKSFTDTAAISGAYYCYYVVAVTENGSKSAVSNVIGKTCPLAAPVVTVSNIESSGKVRITWTAVEGAVKYQVYRATSKNGTYTHLMTTSGTACNNVSAETGATYYYKVKALAKDSAADSSFSAAKGRTCDLPRPVVTVANNAPNGKIWITWKPIEGAVKYQVYCATSKDGTYKRILTTTGTHCKHNSAEVGVTYYYKVRAVAESSNATSAYSAIKARTCDIAQPQITAVSGPTGKPRVTWEAVEGAVKYRVYRATSAEGPYKLKYTTEGTSYTNSGAALGETFYYKVRAISDVTAANSAYSEIDSATAISNVYQYVYSSYSTTKYGTAARNTNLALSCKAINGTILAPGEEFSFNEIVGPRTEKKGYLIAGQTGGGEGRGGGICQVSTTLFNAALLGNLKITRRYQHSEAISYAPRGRDAMLYASKCDFKFRNNTEYYIKVQAKASAGTVTITFLTRESGVSPRADVDLVVTQSGNTYTLTRYFQGVANYTTKSTY